MNLSSSYAYVFTALALAAPLSGCKVEASGSLETPVRYEGSSQSLSAAYTSGMAVQISGPNGNIDVKSGGGSDVSVKFSPFILDKRDNEDNARAHMEKNLSFTVGESTDGSTIVVQVDKASGSSGGLGADIVVSLPDGFDGNFVLDQGNGGTDINLGSFSPLNLDIFSDNGSVDLTLGAFAPGTVTLDGAGDLYLGIPADSNGELTALTDGVGDIVITNTPSTWEASPDNSEQAQSFTMGDGTGGRLDLVADFDIEIDPR
jgi:hypothetical protein